MSDQQAVSVGCPTCGSHSYRAFLEGCTETPDSWHGEAAIAMFYTRPKSEVDPPNE